MKKAKRILALVLSAAILMLALSCASFALDSDSVTVDLSVYDGSVISPKQELTVTDGIAEEYGFTVSASDHNGVTIDEPTVFDALVAAHKAMYGDAFTKETASDYLVMTSGFITKAFGKSASSSGFIVNGRTPNDGIYNELYGSYTSYACDTAEIKDNDYISYYYYQDTDYWSDAIADLSADNTEVNVGEAVTFSVTAFSSWCGSMTEEVIEMNTVKCPDIDIYAYSDSGSVKVGTTDAEGNAVVTFDEAGTYQLYCAGSADVGLGVESPLVADWITVTVSDTETPDEPAESDSFLFRVFKTVVSVVKVVFNIVVDFVSDILGKVF